MLYIYPTVRPPNLKTIYNSLERLKLPVDTICNLSIKFCDKKDNNNNTITFPYIHIVTLSIKLQSLTCTTILHYECLLLLQDSNQVCISNTINEYNENCKLFNNIKYIEHHIPINKLLPLFRSDDISYIDTLRTSSIRKNNSNIKSSLSSSSFNTSLIFTSSGIIKRSLEQQHSLTRLIYVPHLVD